MAKQFGTTLRNAMANAIEATVGTSPKLRIYTGTQPATPATAASGTLLIEMTLPSDWLGAASSGTVSKAGTWSGTVIADGAAGHYRVTDSAGTTVHEQGAVSQAFTLTTSSSTAALNNVLTFTATTGATVGMGISGSGIPSGATVSAVSSTTVTMSAPSVGGVSSAAVITFGDVSGDLTLNSTALTTSQVLTIDTFTRTAPGA